MISDCIKENMDNLVNTGYYMKVSTLAGEVITSGKIVNQKNMCTVNSEYAHLGNWFSVDNNYFFNINSNNFLIDVVSDVLPEIPVKKDMLKGLTVKEWMKLVNRFTTVRKAKRKAEKIDVFTDKGLDEADIEIKEFLYFLNRIPGVTTISSCCGHRKHPMYISFVLDSREPQRAIDTFQKMFFVLHRLLLENLIFIRADTHHFIGGDYKTEDLKLEFYSNGRGDEEVWKGLRRFQTLYETLFQV